MVKRVTGKVVKTECIEARMSKDFKLAVHVETKGLDCFDESPKISLTLNSSGVVIVHSCEEVFIRTSNIERIENFTDSASGAEYTRIFFKWVD